jgi:hypothetical protein
MRNRSFETVARRIQLSLFATGLVASLLTGSTGAVFGWAKTSASAFIGHGDTRDSGKRPLIIDTAMPFIASTWSAAPVEGRQPENDSVQDFLPELLPELETVLSSGS